MARRGGRRLRQSFSFDLGASSRSRRAETRRFGHLATAVYAFVSSSGGPSALKPCVCSHHALFTNTLVALPTSALGFIFLLAIGAFFFFNRLQMLWYTERTRLIVVTVALLAGLAGLNWVLNGYGWGWPQRCSLDGSRRPSSDDGEKFAPLVHVPGGAERQRVGAGLVWLWPGGLSALVGGPRGLVHGTGPMVLMTVCA